MEIGKMNMGDGADKRRHKRVEVEVPVKYKVINRKVVKELVDAKQLFDDGKSINISMSGISLTTRLALNKGDYLKMEMSLPRSQRLTRALAEVMWVTQDPGAEGHRAGIRFLIILNEADEHSIKRFVQTHGG